jgi:hypothetical protein
MGCASSVNIQIEEDKDNRKLLANGKEVGTIKKYQNEDEEKKSKESKDEDYMDLPTIKQSNENTNSKILTNSKNLNAHNIKINNNYNQSTNFKYLKENKINLIKSNPVIKDNKNEENNKYKFIPLRHPLDISSEKKNSSLKNLNISEEREKNNENENKKINKNDIDVMNSMEERINNYHGNNNNYNEYEEEDGVNMGNYRDEENDDMVNFGQSMTNDKINEAINEQKEICVIFEIQSTGERHYINTKKDIKFNDLVEIFKNKIDLSPFEKPEFMFNGVYLIDYDKPISEYNINDKSKINVYI